MVGEEVLEDPAVVAEAVEVVVQVVRKSPTHATFLRQGGLQNFIIVSYVFRRWRKPRFMQK